MFSRFSFLTLSAVLFLGITADAKTVTEKAARDIAVNFLASKGMPHKELVTIRPVGEQAQFRAPSVGAEAPAYHLFSDTEHKSFIVISGDDIARPVLGYSFNINGDTDGNIPPAMKDWLDDIESQINLARRNGLTQDDYDGRVSYLPYDSVNVIKKLNTAQWGQNYPFNNQCPYANNYRCITGCTSTSYAIIMKFYGYPSSGRGVAPAYTGSKGVHVGNRDVKHEYKWDLMPLNLDNSSSYQQIYAVSQLMADIGASIRADYSTDETAAKYNKEAIFAHFDYYLGVQKQKAEFTPQQWNTMLRNELDQNHPILYYGKSSTDEGAHSFVIDGYADNDYFCVNWGWAGSHNGVYTLDAMNLPNYNYNGTQGAYLDLQPATGLPSVAMVDDSIMCPSLEAAFGMAPAGGQCANVTLLENISTDEAYVQDFQNVILDLNGHSVEFLNWGLFNYGNLTIKDSQTGGKITVNKYNTQILSNCGVMTIESGNYINQAAISSGNPDYRRCLWTAQGSVTHIKAGKFSSKGETVCSNGKTIIDNGEFVSTGNAGVILNYSATDSMIIRGGTFKNLTTATESSNYRRTLWADKNSVTLITGGSFSCRYQVAFCRNGEMRIDGGTFETSGNEAVLTNYTGSTLTINGGTFKNVSTEVTGSNYRRALYTYAESKTTINGGSFYAPFQVVTIVGDATINGGSIDNTNSGLGCLSAGTVVINNCKIKATRVVNTSNNGTLKCYGGLYSQVVEDAFLGPSCKCLTNYELATSAVYPYKVVNMASGIDPVISTQNDNADYYINGIMGSGNNQGIHIIRSADGQTKKVLYK
jgi:hypothetical protein